MKYIILQLLLAWKQIITNLVELRHSLTLLRLTHKCRLVANITKHCRMEDRLSDHHVELPRGVVH